MSTSLFSRSPKRSSLAAGFAGAAVLFACPQLSLHAAQPVQQQTEQQQTEQQQTEQQQTEQQQTEQQQTEQQRRQRGPAATNMAQQHADDECEALGVVVSSCPGDAVCVDGTMWGSPADEAGIREGDYILSIDGQRVRSPKELIQKIHENENSQQVTLVLWRQGQEVTKQVPLASEAEELPPSHRAWLGVVLSSARGESESEGVSVERVIPDGPADEAGLRSGDTIVGLNDQQVSDVESFVQSVQDLGPESQLQLTIRRNGQEQQLSATLSSVEEAPMAFLRQAFRSPMSDALSGAPSGRGSAASDAVVDETLNELRQRLHELEMQVQELTSRSGAGAGEGSGAGQRRSRRPAAENRQENRQERREGRDERDERRQESREFDYSSTLSVPEAVMLVVQRDGRDRDRGDRDGRDRDWDRDRDRGWDRDRDRGWDRGRNWNNRGYYGDGYRSGYRGDSYRRYYRSPYYGNSYYRYNGQPYYYGYGRNRGTYGRNYGLRSGIQLGPNLGIYWY